MKPLISHSFVMTKNKQTFKLNESMTSVTKDLWISLKNVYVNVGVFNVTSQETIRVDRLSSHGINTNAFIIQPGRYNIDYFKTLFKDEDWITIDIDHFSSKITITIAIFTDKRYVVYFSKAIKKILGLKLKANQALVPGTSVSYYKINPQQVLHLHCDQISKENNFYNGEPCDLLSTIPIVEKGNNDFNPFFYLNLKGQMKQLIHDRITELTFSLRDCKDRIIDNRGREIILEVEIY